jgi:alkylation response protein AidB-like acyl-CoA dehydrogenase
MIARSDVRVVVAGLEPALRAAVEPGERDRCLPQSLTDALWDAGLFSMGAPRDRGGAELDPLTRLHAIETIARYNAAAAWVLMICNSNAYWAGALVAPEVLDAFWKPGERMIMAGTFDPVGRAERVPGGHRLSGRWRFGSGGQQASWFTSGAFVFENGERVLRKNGAPLSLNFITPASDVVIDKKSWDVTGLLGTGSHDYAIEDAFVPEGRSFQQTFQRSRRPEPVYRYLFLEGGNMSAVSLGIARAALDELTANLLRKIDRMTGKPLADGDRAQEALARAEGLLGAARAFVHEQTADLWETLLRGDRPTLQQCGLHNAAAVQGVMFARGAIELAREASGSDGIFRTSPIERAFRDVSTAATHITMRPSAFVTTGQLLLGRPTRFS